MKISKIKNIEPLGFQWKAIDPFLFCVHHNDKYPKGNNFLGPDHALLKGRQIGQDFILKDGWRMYHGQKVPGFPCHPHRGFETVTIVRKGFVDHSNSMKAAGGYGNGDVQWMNAGRGIQHAEMFPLINNNRENHLELFQIWLNLPKKNKMVEPYFSMLWADTIPNYTHTDNNGKQTTIEIIAGAIDNYKAPSPPPDSWANIAENEVAIWIINMKKGAKWNFPKSNYGINRTIYFYKGTSLTVDDTILPEYHMAELMPNSDILLRANESECSILVLQGKSIGEPVEQYGPFVMNSREEIQQTYAEYQRTQFGGWPWDVTEPTHGIEGRFARHSNGIIEKKD